MTTLYDCPVRDKKDYPNAVWKDNPEKHPYVRESTFITHDPEILPMGDIRIRDVGDRRRTNIYIKLVGYVIMKMGNIYGGPHWYVMSCDLGMPEEDTGYGREKWKKDGIIPMEGVTFSPVKEHRSLKDDMSDAEREYWNLESNLGSREIFDVRS